MNKTNLVSNQVLRQHVAQIVENGINHLKLKNNLGEKKEAKKAIRGWLGTSPTSLAKTDLLHQVIRMLNILEHINVIFKTRNKFPTFSNSVFLISNIENILFYIFE